MGRFDSIGNNFDDVVNKASLKNKSDKKLKNILVYNIPVEWVDILKEHNLSFSSYARMAVLEKLKRDNLI